MKQTNNNNNKEKAEEKKMKEMKNNFNQIQKSRRFSYLRKTVDDLQLMKYEPLIGDRQSVVLIKINPESSPR